ncbi:MAG: OmpA family protein [Chromatiales bacterium]
MKYKLATLAASLGMAASIGMLPVTSSAGYLTDSAGKVVVNGYGECWTGIWPNPDNLEMCGDAMAMPMAKDGDADGDGVPDSKDKCPGTPPGAKVDSDGCELDSDGDGVVDSKDKCPGTTAGAKVNKDGCEIIGHVTINLVNDEFDFDSAALKPEMKSALDGVISQINRTKGQEKLSIIGHTDSSGPAEYNQGLSERRAQSVADYMQSKGIAASSMTVSGKGESMPVADNATRDGRKKNRRVEINAE